MGRNPETGETIQIDAKTVVKFRVAKAAKDAILGKKVDFGLSMVERHPDGIRVPFPLYRSCTRISTQCSFLFMQPS